MDRVRKSMKTSLVHKTAWNRMRMTKTYLNFEIFVKNLWLCICRTEFLAKTGVNAKNVPRIPSSLYDQVFALRRPPEYLKIGSLWKKWIWTVPGRTICESKSVGWENWLLGHGLGSRETDICVREVLNGSKCSRSYSEALEILGRLLT